MATVTTVLLRGNRVLQLNLRLVNRVQPELVLVPLVLTTICVVVGDGVKGCSCASVAEELVFLRSAPEITLSSGNLLIPEVGEQNIPLHELVVRLGSGSEGIAFVRGLGDDLHRHLGHLGNLFDFRLNILQFIQILYRIVQFKLSKLCTVLCRDGILRHDLILRLFI